MPGGEHVLHFRKNRLICSGVSSGFSAAKAFQLNKMFQENIILEPVGSALGRRGCLITLRWSKQAPQEQSPSFPASRVPGAVGRPSAWALSKAKTWKVREGTGPGLFHSGSYWKVPELTLGQRAKEALGGGHSKPESDLSQIPQDLIGVTLYCYTVCIPASLLPLPITLSPTWKGFIVK